MGRARQMTAIAAGLLALVVFAVIPASSQGGQTAELRSAIADFVEQERASCCCKMEMIESDSANIWECGVRAARKARFIVENRQQLIGEMLGNGVAGKCHRVDYYLTTRFFESVVEETATDRLQASSK